MKKTRKFAAMIAAMAMAATMTVPSFMMTASADHTITIESASGSVVDASKHKFDAYQIFTGTPNTGVTGFTGDNTSVAWGSAITTPSDFITALNTAFSFGLATDASAYTVSQKLETIKDDAAKCAQLAEVINTYISTATTTYQYNGGGEAATISVPDGYYFVRDVTFTGNQTSSNDALSKFILQVVGDQTVTIKTDAPQIEKKIWNNDSADAPTAADFTTTKPTASADLTTAGWNDVGDNKIGDTVYFYVKTTVPDTSNYETYKYVINDTLADGLTFNTTGTPITMVYFQGSTAKTITVHVGATADAEDSTPEVKFDGQNMTIDFVDLKAFLTANNITWTAGDEIYTYYNATLNANALVSDSANGTQGNKNEAYLTYSNNPNQSGSGDDHPTGETPHDTVHDWTYTFKGSKVDENNDPLNGATFSLYAGVYNSSEENVISLTEITAAENLHVNGITTLDANTRYFRPAVAGETGMTSFVAGSDDSSSSIYNKTKFVFVGLDDVKTYTLREVSAPSESYTPASPVALAATAAHDTETLDGDKLATLVKTAGGENGDATVINYKGSTLPSTGGMGTTLFIVGGGLTAAAAGIYLVSRKRAKDTE